MYSPCHNNCFMEIAEVIQTIVLKINKIVDAVAILPITWATPIVGMISNNNKRGILFKNFIVDGLGDAKIRNPNYIQTITIKKNS